MLWQRARTAQKKTFDSIDTGGCLFCPENVIYKFLLLRPSRVLEPSVKRQSKLPFIMIQNPKRGIVVEISSASIYECSFASVCLKAEKEFSASLTSEVVSINIGRRDEKDSNLLIAEKKDGSYIIAVEVLGLLRERRFNLSAGDHDENRYGMRFYPFVSSFIQGDITTRNLPISYIIVELPDTFRIIWFGASIISSIGENSILRHSYGADKSKYIFSWVSDLNREGKYILSIPVRLGGSTLLKISSFPLLYYWFLSLCVVSIASLSDQVTVLLAAIGAILTFMMQQYNNSNIPQNNTVLTWIYIAEGLFTIFWGICWKIFGWQGLFLSIPAFSIFYILNLTINSFVKKGVLPATIEKYWRHQIQKQISSQEQELVGKEGNNIKA